MAEQQTDQTPVPDATSDGSPNSNSATRCRSAARSARSQLLALSARLHVHYEFHLF
jgi:hypothetical protein